MKASIIVYGVGNLFSVHAALRKCGVDEVIFAKTAEEILNADRLILPGVGAFSDGMKGLRDGNLIDPLTEFVNTGKPLMGICLGMQMLGSESEEFGIFEGLNLIPGKVKKIPSSGPSNVIRKVPFVGWAELNINTSDKFEPNILGKTANKSAVYLVHSYQFVPDNDSNILAFYDYNGLEVCAAVQSGNVIGFQFHPEKSSKIGLSIIENFLSSI